MSVFIGSDHHLNHKNTLKFKSELGFDNIKDYNDFVIEQHNSVVNKRDKVIFLGDLIFGNNIEYIISRMNGIKELYLGNHEKQNIKHYVNHFINIRAIQKYKKLFILSHTPIHPYELRNNWKLPNVHGHLHDIVDLGPNYLNVNIQFHDYKPWSIEEILDTLSKRK